MGSSIHRLLRRRITITGGISPSEPITTINSMLRHQKITTNTIIANSRTFLKLPYFFRKSRDFSNGFSSSPSFFTSPFSSASQSSSITASFVGWYLGMVKTRPILTKSATCAVIYVAADLSSQTIARPVSEPYDLVRTLRMAGYGMLVLGPTLHFWFNFVSRQFPKRDLITTFKKIILGQTVYGPAMTALFFSLNACLQGENGSEIVARLKRDLLPTMMNGVMYWPICDFITFKFIPVHLQPLVSNSFSYLWTVYMTYMASREKVDSSS
ncbi:Protein SYM1, putative [Ricinus communis]|uniref:Protein SYM1, putative n=1 Tax=Ricinus communis TaxID=3988 RepID=B9SNC3_RICCO|nr:Protein SYM1, putative [Ricinus communis]|eukprot:XP_002527492.1 PXMP2/4 family protein 4 [Ricinus communis]